MTSSVAKELLDVKSGLLKVGGFDLGFLKDEDLLEDVDLLDVEDLLDDVGLSDDLSDVGDRSF